MIALTILCITVAAESALAYLHAISRAEAAYLAMYELPLNRED